MWRGGVAAAASSCHADRMTARISHSALVAAGLSAEQISLIYQIAEEQRRARWREAQARSRGGGGGVSRGQRDGMTKSRGTRLSADWVPSEADAIFGRDRLGGEWHGQVERFRNYWVGKSGASATKLDWSATWRNWVLKAVDDGKGRSGYDKREERRSRLEAALDRISGRAGSGDVGVLPPRPGRGS